MKHEDIANYADDIRPYVYGKNIDEVVRFLEESPRIIFKWFSENHFQANTSKSHVLLSTDQHVQIKIGAAQIEYSSSVEKSLGVTIFFFFSIGVFFHEHSRITVLQGKGDGISLTPHQHFYPLHRHLDISHMIIAESSPLHIVSSRNRTGNLWFPSTSC